MSIVPTRPEGAFECSIAGVRCVIGFGDKGVLWYYRDYDPHILPPPQTLAADSGLGGADCISVPYDPAKVRKVMTDLLPGIDAPGAEWQLAYDPVSRGMLRFDRLTFHGACIEFRGKAYIFTAGSGTGKSTHIRLWRKYLGPAVRIINGDKPIIAIDEEEPGGLSIKACGSPWSGKERWQRNVQVPLGAICMLRRGTDNLIRMASKQESLDDLVSRIYLTKDPQEAVKALDLLGVLLDHVPMCVLSCDMSEDAVRASFGGMTGESYGAWKV